MLNDVLRSPVTVVAAALFISAIPSSAQDTPGSSDPVAYRAVPIEGPQSVVSLRKQVGADGFAIVLKVNRLDLEHVRQGETLMVPDGAPDLLRVSPFPAQISRDLAPAERILFVSRRIQAFAAYEKGTLVRWGPVSTGRKETPTPAALYHTNWRAKLRRSTDNDQWILPWLFNFENSRGISFHQFDLPGYPASHACVRLLEDDAKWIFNWAESWVLSEDRRTVVAHGTPVVVFGDYAYDAPPPWKRLADDPLAASVAAAELDLALEPHVALIVERAQKRGEVVAASR